MTDATAKFPGAAGVSQLAQSDVGGEIVGLPESEWTLATQILAGAVAPFSVVVNEAVSARVPTTGWLTLDSEIVHYNALNTGTKTFTVDARSQQDTAAGQHDVGTWVGFAVTKRWYNQIVADIISMQTEMFRSPLPNMVPNSDGGRRTTTGLVFNEVFADTSGYVAVNGGGTVAANIFTGNAANPEIAWSNQSFVWRDGRVSGTFKAVSATGIYRLKWKVDSTHWISVSQDNGNFKITKATAGTDVDQTVTGQALTVNRWYWLELELQGQTAIAKIYDTLGTVSGVTKASSTLLNTLTVASLGYTIAGAHVAFNSDQTAVQVGGIATLNGGVYVETSTQESAPITIAGTLGGMSWGFDESADSGPIGKQWAATAYVPAISRTMTQDWTIPFVAPSTAYAWSYYIKLSGLGGSGVMARLSLIEKSSAGATLATTDLDDLGTESTYTRKTKTVITNASTTNAVLRVSINPSSTRTGTVRYSCEMLEQGAVATAWRNAPADDAPIVWELVSTRDLTGLAAGEADSRDLAGNFFLPWDATLDIRASGAWSNSGANDNNLLASVDGANTGNMTISRSGATVNPFTAFSSKGHASSLGHAAGKTRIALRVNPSAGTISLLGTSWMNTQFIVTAYRAK